jgi:triacylglycerol lipase
MAKDTARTARRERKQPVTTAPPQPTLDPRLTLALAQASVAAYADFDGSTVVPPPNYRLVARWTGWDASIFGGTEERYGLLFQSTLPGAWKTFIFAFRGTDSDLDAYEDAFFDTTRFVPTRGRVTPSPEVAAGFYSIYDDHGGGMPRSMREQLFALVAQHQPRRMYITGHSLGGALSQLFALDVAVSLPTLWAANLNFASPRVGTSSWCTAYAAQAAQKDPERRTVRVYNHWDYVPSLPPSAFGYGAVGAGFRTAFHVQDEWYPHELSRHSMLNLQTVLTHAVWNDPQVWVGTFQDATDPRRTMSSTMPPAAADPDWASRFGDLVTRTPAAPRTKKPPTRR